MKLGLIKIKTNDVSDPCLSLKRCIKVDCFEFHSFKMEKRVICLHQTVNVKIGIGTHIFKYSSK